MESAQPRRRSILRPLGLLLAGVAAAGLVATGVFWSRRTPIATDLIARELARRGIPATFKLASIGLREQRIADLVLGDPAHPDLTVREASIRIGIGLHGPYLAFARADGVRLVGTIRDGRVSFGAVDRLLPAPSANAAPFALPALPVELHDARVRLATPWGAVAAALDGGGRLDDGFAGRAAIVSADLAGGGCAVRGFRALVNVAVADRAPMLDGPLFAERLRCGPVTAERPAVALDAGFTRRLDGWHGSARLSATRVGVPGVTVLAPAAQLGFQGDRRSTRSGIDAEARALLAGAVRGGAVRFSGRLEAGSAHPFTLSGRVNAEHLALDERQRRVILQAATRMQGTPVGAVAAQLASHVAQAAADVEGGADLTAAGARVVLGNLSLRSASGGTLSVGAGTRLVAGTGGLDANGTISLGGGGLPATRLLFTTSRPGARAAGVLSVASMVASDATLTIGRIAFVVGRTGAIGFTSDLRLSGPLPGGRIDGLALPVDGRWSGGELSLLPGCRRVSFDRLRVQSLDLAPGLVPVCANRLAALTLRDGRAGGGLRLGAFRLDGRLGTAPLRLAADGGTLAPAGLRFVLDGMDVRLGPDATVNRLRLARLEGEGTSAGLSGRFKGAAGKLAAVPFGMSGAEGRWRVFGGTLALADVALTLSDTVQPVRFRPMLGDGFTLRLAGSRIETAGRLIEPHGRAVLASLRIRHDLDRGAGEARFDVGQLRFGPRLQPDQLTPLTVGVVANVAGAVTGDGSVRWTPEGVTSSGDFRTDRLDLAAAFGPVTGLSGGIHFSDLVNLATPPGQEVRLAAVNPGVEVADGRVRYQLLPGQQVVLEGGRWPFAGGTLLLEPARLSFAGNAERRFTLRVDGLDAARFIEQVQLANISATGTFDGTLPLVFGADGGRIVGGRLVARPGGGTLSYVGDVSNAQLGTYGKMAFDALKSLRYRSLALDLDGALDGEIVSRVGVSGVNQQPVGAQIGGLSKKLTGLPFRFNITVRAPFRGLMGTARTFADPTSLLRQEGAPAVQPK